MWIDVFLNIPNQDTVYRNCTHSNMHQGSSVNNDFCAGSQFNLFCQIPLEPSPLVLL